ncbi:MAG: TylF/MycF/NovP-related O-methyltransferase [Allosphingosinicella sp.]
MRKFASFLRNVASKSDDRRMFALKMIANRFLPDYRFTWAHLDWWRDEGFNAYLERFGERGGFNTHRKWTLWQLMRMTAHVPGDTAECGVFEGASSWLICSATRGTDKIHHLFDSFEGLSAPQSEDGGYWKPGDFATPEQVVLDNLAPFADRIRLHKGWIPERFGDVADRTFSFVHVDVDLYQPTIDSMRFFYDRLSPGGILLCDDYACGTCPGASASIDEFLADKPEKMLSLDAGGGFFVKGIPVAPAASPGAGVAGAADQAAG